MIMAGEDGQVVQTNDRAVIQSRQYCRFKWIPTSASLLEAAETRIFRYLKAKYEGRFVPISRNQSKLWTVMFHSRYSTRTPFVFVHGFGAGVGLWALNIDSACKQRPLYAFDLLGFGRSSRPTFPKNPAAVEDQFVYSIERWREELKLDKMILVGHSFGGYLVSSYALKYPDRVKKLVLVDPWGFPEKPSNFESRIPLIVRIIANIVLSTTGTMLAVLRAAGPYGPDLLKKARADLQEKYSDLFDDDTITNYIFHCNAQNPSGEIGFKSLLGPWGFAKFPLIHRIHEIRKDIPITFIYGENTYSIIDNSMGKRTKEIRKDSQVDVHLVKDASHHVYSDQVYQFNQLLLDTCKEVP